MSTATTRQRRTTLLFKRGTPTLSSLMRSTLNKTPQKWLKLSSTVRKFSRRGQLQQTFKEPHIKTRTFLGTKTRRRLRLCSVQRLCLRRISLPDKPILSTAPFLQAPRTTRLKRERTILLTALCSPTRRSIKQFTVFMVAQSWEALARELKFFLVKMHPNMTKAAKTSK